MERLQKLIAQSGLCSRRAAEALIEAGRVRKNGVTARLGDTADLSIDLVEVDGVPLQLPEATTTLILHKPRGYVTTASDEKGRRTVMELLPEGCPRLFPVGRLDRFSEGLLLLTNDGALAQRLTHPKGETEKVYLLWVSRWQPGADRLLRRRIVLDGKPILPPGVRLLWQRGETAQLEITLREGRNRQIRRMCEQAELTCTRLKRIRVGRLELGDLPPGKTRELTAEERAWLNEEIMEK